MTKRILLTGATGFIGRHCLASLVGRGYEVHGVSSQPQRSNSQQVWWHQADLTDFTQIQQLIAQIQPTDLLHLAWYLVPGKFVKANENYDWVQISLELLRQFQEHGGKRVVMAGTCFEYDWQYGYCSELLTPTAPNTFYGKCKNTLQLLLDNYAQQTGLSSAWARVFLLYGPHENPSRLVSSVICSLLQGKVAKCSHGKQIRDYLHVQDVADALVTLLASDVVGPVNIGSGIPVTIKDIVQNIAQQLNAQELLQLGALPAATNDTDLVVANIARLRDEVGWQPAYDLDSGLEQTIGWWKNQLKL